jgi:hypothetical protein
MDVKKPVRKAEKKRGGIPRKQSTVAEEWGCTSEALIVARQCLKSVETKPSASKMALFT